MEKANASPWNQNKDMMTLLIMRLFGDCCCCSRVFKLFIVL